MVILTSQTFDTFKATIHSSVETGMKILYRASCTAGEQAAAKAVVRKYFSQAAAETVQAVTTTSEIKALTGSYFDNPQRKQVFEVWTFDSTKLDKPKRFKVPGDSQPAPGLPLGIVPTPKPEKPRPKREASNLPSSVSASSVLSEASAALTKLRDIIVRHEDKFATMTLGPRLQMGLACLKAHHAFAVPEPGKRNKKGKNQHGGGLVTRDEASPGGFEGWLLTEHQWLKKATAYKYMEAVHGLGLDHTATANQLSAALKLLLRKEKHLTLKSLIDRCPARLGADDPAPEPQQSEFDFIRSNLSAFREEANTLIAIADRLRQIPDAHRAACARAYTLLRELTGSDWSPSDTPDSLASVDPDTLTI